MVVSNTSARKTRILFLAANPRDTVPLRLGEEIRLIEERLRAADYRDQFELTQHHALRQSDLTEFLLRDRPDIVHFSGHGSSNGEIVLEDNQGNARVVPAEALRNLFGILKDNIRCVVLNACWSEAQAKAIAQEIDCVVGMVQEIGDDEAIHFDGGFYSALAYGRDVETAFKLGSNEIDLSGLSGSVIPQLLTRPGVNAAEVFFAGVKAIPATSIVEPSPLPSVGTSLVFISYSRSNREWTQRLITDLQARGIPVWIDERDLVAGTPDWEEAIRAAIRGARAVLLIASLASRQSRYVKDELRIADMYQRKVYSVWIEGNDWIDAIPIGWGSAQKIDARGERYTTALEEIVRVLTGEYRSFADAPKDQRDRMIKMVRQSLNSSRTNILVENANPIKLSSVRIDDLVTGGINLRTYHTKPSTSQSISPYELLSLSDTLLIVGEPGSGKTTTLQELTHEALLQAEHDLASPIPFLFSLSSWTNSRDEIDEWLVDELLKRYRISQQVAEGWLKHQDLLILLDGLDEVLKQYQSDCIDAINRFCARFDETSIVVCCRIKDYRSLERKLNFGTAISLQDLATEQVIEFLHSIIENPQQSSMSGTSSSIQGFRQEQLRNVQFLIEHIYESPDLEELARTPLMLKLMIVALEEMKNFEVTNDKAFYIHNLFEVYINKMFAVSPSNREYTYNQTRRYLRWLATKSSTFFLIEGLQPKWNPESVVIFSIIVKVIITVPPSVFAGVASGIIAEIAGRAINEPTGFGFLFFGPSAALTVALTILLSIQKQFGWLGGLVLGTMLAISFAVPLTLSLGVIPGISAGAFVGITLGIIYGVGGKRLFSGIKVSWTEIGLSALLEPDLHKLPFGIVPSIFVGLVSGIIATIAVASSARQEAAPISGLAVGLGLGIGVLLLNTLSARDMDKTSEPNQGIWYSFRNAFFIGTLGGVILGTSTGIATGLPFGISIGVMCGIGYGLAGMSVLSTFYGGLACIQHFTLRVLLTIAGKTPWNYKRFLEYSKNHILLKRSDGAYSFIHPLFQKHVSSASYEERVD